MGEKNALLLQKEPLILTAYTGYNAEWGEGGVLQQGCDDIAALGTGVQGVSRPDSRFDTPPEIFREI